MGCELLRKMGEFAQAPNPCTPAANVGLLLSMDQVIIVINWLLKVEFAGSEWQTSLTKKAILFNGILFYLTNTAQFIINIIWLI